MGIALYLATAPDGASAPAEADAVSSRPLMQAQPVALPASNVIRIASASPPKTREVSSGSTGGNSRVRQLQKALARAGCYYGPVNGVWSGASKDAMRGFVKSVNAELPVESPDEALVALMESNETAQCKTGRVIETGALGTSPSATSDHPGVAPPADKSAPQSAAAIPVVRAPSDPTLLGRAWAPEVMLTPPKQIAAAPPATAPDLIRPPAAERTASNNVTLTDASPASAPESTIHFEGGKPLPAIQTPDPAPAVSPPVADPRAEVPAKSKKSKTAKRRPAKDDDVQTTISKGFDNLQRSLSSMF